MRRSVARFAMTLGAFALASGVTKGGDGHRGWVAEAAAQDATELAAARKLFAEALADEAAQRYAPALEKFQRVQAVRDTQAVRYRVATCLEALGKLRAALEAYTAASVASGTDAESASIARVSREKMDAISGRVARVVVKLGPKAPDDATVKIDGETIQPNAVGTPIVVDPGAHEITAAGSGATPFRAQTTIAEGGTITIDVTLEAPRHAPPLPPMETLPPAPVPAPPPSAPEPAAEPQATSGSSGMTTAGVVAVTAGGVLIAGSVVVLLVRAGDVSSLNQACPGGVCPVSRESELNATRSRALVEGPVAAGLGVAGVVAAGVGVFLLVKAPGKRSTALAPWVDHGAGGVAWSGAF